MARQFKDRLPEVIEFYKKYGRLPNQNSENKEEVSLYKWIYYYKSSYQPLTNFLKENGIEVKKKLTKEEQNHRNYQNFLLLREYCEKNNYDLSDLWKKDKQLYSWMHNHNSSYPPLTNFLKENGIEVKKRLTNEEQNHRDYRNLQDLQEYYENNNHSLLGLWKNNKLYKWYRKYKSSYPPLTNFLKENGIEAKEVKKRLTKEERNHRDYQNFLLIREYYENNNYDLLGLAKKDKQLYWWMHYYKSSYPPLIDFLKENGIEILTKEEQNHRNFQDLREYYKNNNHSLSGLWKNIKLYSWYNYYKSSYSPLSEFLDIIEEIELGNKEALLLYNLKYSSQQ